MSVILKGTSFIMCVGLEKAEPHLETNYQLFVIDPLEQIICEKYYKSKMFHIVLFMRQPILYVKSDVFHFIGDRILNNLVKFLLRTTFFLVSSQSKT